MMEATVTPFFDPATFTYSYVVQDPSSNACAVIDAVLDYDPASGRISTESADRIAAHVKAHDLQVDWLLDTHVHADHLSASHYLQRKLGGRTAIGCQVRQVQKTFSALFNVVLDINGQQFDRLLAPDASFRIGNLVGKVLSTPGHTPACVSYVFEDMAFVGDTLFMPDYGTARTDFPGGDAATLYLSIQRLLALPGDTRLFLCHDYLTGERTEYSHVTTVAEQRAHNVHVHEGVTAEDFVAAREARDKELAAPRLLLPSVQFNMRGGRLPPAETNGTRYFKIPLRTEIEEVLA